MIVRLGRGGEAGVSAGIVIMALLLASAAAASAVLSAIDDSAEQAQAAASDAVLEVATGLIIREAVCHAHDGRVTSLQALIALQAGSPPIRLDSMIISIVTARESILLDAHAYRAREILILNGENGVLERGEIAKLELVLTSDIMAGDRLKLSIILAQGQAATERINIPGTITDGPFILK